MKLKQCARCGHDVHPERDSDYCAPCVDADWRLIERAPVIIHTSHKQGPMVVRPDLYEGTSAYDRG